MDAPTDAAARNELKEEIKKELKHEAFHRRLFARGGCLLTLLLILGIPTVFAAGVVAKTGLVQIPVFSSALSAPVKPTRTVLPLGTSTSASVLRAITTRAKYEPHVGIVTFTAKEQELTTLLQHAVWEAPEGSLPLKIRTGQIAVLPNAIEVFLILPRKVGETTALLRFKPTVRTNGAIDFEIQDLRIGSQHVPSWLSGVLVSALDTFVTEPIRRQIGAMGTLTDIKEEEGSVRILLAPAKALR